MKWSHLKFNSHAEVYTVVNQNLKLQWSMVICIDMSSVQLQTQLWTSTICVGIV